MIKKGNRVAPFFNMGQEGVVIQLIENKVKNAHSAHGSFAAQFYAVVKLDKDGKEIKVRCSDLMRLD